MLRECVTGFVNFYLISFVVFKIVLVNYVMCSEDVLNFVFPYYWVHRNETEEVTCALTKCVNRLRVWHMPIQCRACDNFLSSCLDRRHRVVRTDTCQINTAALAKINETTINKCARQEVVNAQTIIADIQLSIVFTIDWPIWCISHSHGSVSVVRTTFKVYGKMQTLTLSQPKTPEPIVTKF